MNEQAAAIVASKILFDLEYIRALLALADRQANAAINDPDGFTPRALYDCVIKANASYGHLEEQIEDLLDLTRRMIQQRESVKEAYGQGWRGALNDLVDRLNRAEYADLRQALDEITQGKR